MPIYRSAFVLRMQGNRLMRAKYYISFVLILLITLVTILNQTPVALAQGSETSTAQQALEMAWQRAQTSGAYAFRTLINQTIYPAPKVSNAGRAPEKERVGIEGRINSYAQTFNMTFWRNGTFDPAQGIEMKMENGRSYARTGLGTWEEVGGITESFAPAGDPLNFLAGVNNVAQGEETTFALGPIEETFITYHFDLDGRELAAYTRRLLEHQLQERGELPAGMRLGDLDGYQQMSGTGELWVNSEGLPTRLLLDLDMGETEDGEWVTAVITTEFSNFDMTLLETSFIAEPQTWLSAKLPTAAVQQEVGINIALLLTLVLLLTLFALYWQKGWMYRVIATIIIVSLVFSPLLNGEVAHAHHTRVRAQAEQQQADEDKVAMIENGRKALQQNEWNPHQDPRRTNSKLVNNNTQLATNNNTPAALNQATTADTDSDGDGLSDDAEAFWQTCAYPYGSIEYNNADSCSDIADPTDSDGDGLTDGTEANQLYTFPDDPDSDGDSITDTLEIEGFAYNGQQWYLNPNEADSNSDGIPDAQECEVWYPGSPNFDPTAICPDTDNDGTPDVFDNDNDNDGVLDIDDLASDQKGPETYTHDNPLKVSIDGLQTDKPVIVELQFRPTEADHLNYSGLILDWPSGDYEGQIQRGLDTTFASTANPEIVSTAPNASFGDIKIFPMLEIYIPYSDGHYGNLPVNNTYAGINRTLDLTVSQWLDTSELAPYAVTIIDADEESGDLVAYVPLATMTSHVADEVVAFGAQMLYYPSQGSNGLVDWGAGHEYRVTWVVQMITDACIDDLDEDGDGDPDNEDATSCQREDSLNIIHSYEEAWEMTGFTINEAHGYDAALLYENPTQDDSLTYDEQLWLYSWNLANTFVTGLDCDSVVNDNCVGDGQRDVTLDNLSGHLDTWGTDENNVNHNYTNIVNKSYLHDDYFPVVAMTDTVDILNTVFLPYADQTYPSILL